MYTHTCTYYVEFRNLGKVNSFICTLYVYYISLILYIVVFYNMKWNKFIFKIFYYFMLYKSIYNSEFCTYSEIAKSGMICICWGWEPQKFRAWGMTLLYTFIFVEHQNKVYVSMIITYRMGQRIFDDRPLRRLRVRTDMERAYSL